MGLPMTRYSLLSKLMRKEENRDNGPDRLEEDVAKEALGRYSLYAFALCDHKDSGFRNYMTAQFSKLDRRTGENLLFFSLVRPDTSVEYTLKRYYDPEEALTAHDSHPVDDRLYQHALLEAFQVSVSDLPAIVLTTSLENNEWYVIPVADEFQTSQWLVTLGKVADDIARGCPVNLTEELDDAVSQSTSSRSWYAAEGVPVCDLLAAVESAAAMAYRRNRNARKVFDEVCGRLNGYVADDEEKRGVVVRLVKYLQTLSLGMARTRSKHPELDCILKTDRQMVEPDTVRYMEIFEELCGNERIRSMGDYTVLCSLMHKIFETEINASVLQLMRQHINIPMPEFYDRFFPDRKDCYVGNINLNRYLKGNPVKYVSPGLGSACTAYRILMEKAEFCESLSGYGINEESVGRLHFLWNEIFNIRNLEAHCQIITEEQYSMMLDAVSEIVRLYLPKFIEMKMKLKGEPLVGTSAQIDLFNL